MLRDKVNKRLIDGTKTETYRFKETAWPVEIETFQNCPRCARQHKRLRFWRLMRSDPFYQLWATCPRTTEPILAKVMMLPETAEMEITICYPP